MPKENKSTYIKDGMYQCECGRKFEKPQSLNSHFARCTIHRNGKPISPRKNGGGWNRDKKMSESYCEKIRTFKSKDVIDGNHSITRTSHLKHRLFKAGLKTDRCENCGISEWLGEKINCQLHHLDGNKHNNDLENLQILCPNCHSLTDTYGGRNVKKKRSMETPLRT